MNSKTQASFSLSKVCYSEKNVKFSPKSQTCHFLKWQLLFWLAVRRLSCRLSVNLECLFRLGENVTGLAVNSDIDQ